MEEIPQTWQEEQSGCQKQSTAVIVADCFAVAPRGGLVSVMVCGGSAWWLGLGRGLQSFAVAHRGGGGRAARVVGPWISERGFESHRGGWSVV